MVRRLKNSNHKNKISWFLSIRWMFFTNQKWSVFLDQKSIKIFIFNRFIIEILQDGWLDIWDYYYRQNELAFSHKVSDSALSCIKLNLTGGGYHNVGKLVAIGDQDGTVTLMELCDSLYSLQPKEKEIIGEVLI